METWLRFAVGQSSIAAAAVLTMAAATDAIHRRIPNALIVSGLILLALAYGYGHGVAPWGTSIKDGLLGCAIAFFGLLAFYAIGVMGAADVKLAGLIGLGVGWQPLLSIWAIASILAGVHGLLIIGLRRTSWWSWAEPLLHGKSSPVAVPDPSRRHKVIPFGSYLTIAVWVSSR